MRHPSVIIVRRPRKAGGAGIHGSAWKVAYADFVTALMAFFLVMWLVGQGQSVRQAVAGYFKDPWVFSQTVPGGHGARGGPEGGTVPIPRPHQTPAGPIVIVEGREPLEKTAGRLRDLLGEMPEFKRLRNQIEIQMTSEGLRIELLETSDGTFFDTGSATLKAESVRVLSTIARELGRLDNDVVIEGHTDSRPYTHADGYSNWELSADRANAARRQLERTGRLHALLLGVRGYADKQLAHPERPLDPRNRRVSIVVLAHIPGQTAASR